jgi:hypothetical protein
MFADHKRNGPLRRAVFFRIILVEKKSKGSYRGDVNRSALAFRSGITNHWSRVIRKHARRRREAI